ncbi:MAG: CYTH domain-containing protein [Lachnospiraceae bacterium]|nr:CYTH domain-containing protein [Lachnospiraceae bacterium]
MGVEIERKFLVKEKPADLEKYPFHVIEQGYLNVIPAIRVRREDDTYYMTYKGRNTGGSGDIGKVEYNMPLDVGSYDHLVKKADGNVIRKMRYLIPLNEDAFDEAYLSDKKDINEQIGKGDIKIELDVFAAPFDEVVIAEVEFPDEETARNYNPAAWFGKEVTGDPEYSNARMSTRIIRT